MTRKRQHAADGTLSTDEAAALAGVTRITICCWVRDGRLRGQYKGRLLLLDRREVEALAAKRKRRRANA